MQDGQPFQFTDYGAVPKVGDGLRFRVAGGEGRAVHVANIHERHALDEFYRGQAGSRSALIGPLVQEKNGVEAGTFERGAAALRELGEALNAFKQVQPVPLPLVPVSLGA